MVFGYPASTTPTPAIWPVLWWIGALMVLVGGYWFWFFIRVDVAAEGHSPFRVVKADLFVLSLLASVTLGVIWAATGGGVSVLFWLYLLATAVLFFGVPWSKFAHMFFRQRFVGGRVEREMFRHKVGRFVSLSKVKPLLRKGLD